MYKHPPQTPQQARLWRLVLLGMVRLLPPNWPTGDLHDVVGSGKYYTSTALNKPTSAGWVQNDTRSTDYIRLTWTSAIDGSKWVQEKIAGTWSAWKRIDPQAFWLGCNLTNSFKCRCRHHADERLLLPSGHVN